MFGRSGGNPEHFGSNDGEGFRDILRGSGVEPPRSLRSLLVFRAEQRAA